MKSRRVVQFVPVGVLLLGAAVLLPLRCGKVAPSIASPGSPAIRVRLQQGVDQVTLTCAAPPAVRLGKGRPAQLDVPARSAVNITLTRQGWMAGSLKLGPPDQIVHLDPLHDGAVSINGLPYRGRFRLVPLEGGKFDVINELDLEAYLAGVLSREMLHGWHEQAYRAQAIVARTYALYEKQTAPPERHWDVFADTRSQVYGGIASETAVSRQAVADTAGIVVAYTHADGQTRIFKAYFSSCCGGVTQSAADAFNEPYIPPLADQNAHAACRNSPRFNWGPIELSREVLTRRFKLFGERRGRPEKEMGTVVKIEAQQTSRWGRPVRFLITDSRGNRFSMSGEEFRWAVNTGASEGAILYSSFVKIINDSDTIRFVEGHGWGHGVGLCQWCAQSRAEAGLCHEDIVLAAFPTALLVRAY